MIYKFSDMDFRYISEMPKDQRPGNVLRDNPTKVSDLGLLCTIMGTNDPDKASRVLELINTGRTEEIYSVGIPKRQVDKVLACIEFARRNNPGSQKTQTPQAVFELVRHYAYSKQEHFIVVMLDGAHNLIGSVVVTIGLVNRTLVHPRECFAEALKQRAAAIVLAHNHPSGNLEPSPDDLEVTHRLKQAGLLLGIDVLDHIIFSTDNFLSMMECGDFV